MKVGFVGMTLEGTPTIVNPAGITTVDFLDEAQTANRYAHELRRKGVKSLVLLLHEGGQQNARSPPDVADPSGCVGFSGAVTGIVASSTRRTASWSAATPTSSTSARCRTRPATTSW